MRKQKLKRLYDLTRMSDEVIEFEFNPRWSNFGVYMLDPHTIQLCVKLMEVAIINKNIDASTRHIKCYPTSICIKKSQDNEVSDSNGKPYQNTAMEMRYNEIQVLLKNDLSAIQENSLQYTIHNS